MDKVFPNQVESNLVEDLEHQRALVLIGFREAFKVRFLKCIP
jgi:hypothetical protein